jgi:hypothetical protein
VIGALLIERVGSGAVPFSERDVEAVTRLASVLSGVMARLAREELLVRHQRRAATNEQALRLLRVAKRLWTSAGGSLVELQETFEQGIVHLLSSSSSSGGSSSGEEEEEVRCTLFMLDPQQGALCGSNREIVPLGVGALGAAALAGRPERDGSQLLYVPVVQQAAAGGGEGESGGGAGQAWTAAGAAAGGSAAACRAPPSLLLALTSSHNLSSAPAGKQAASVHPTGNVTGREK